MTTELEKELSKELSRELLDVFEEAHVDVSSYSGRYMYGKQCVGIVAPDLGWQSDVIQFISSHGKFNLLEEFAQLIKNIKMDNMGKEFVYYNPDVCLPEEDFMGMQR
jgi:peptide deformylase